MNWMPSRGQKSYWGALCSFVWQIWPFGWVQHARALLFCFSLKKRQKVSLVLHDSDCMWVHPVEYKMEEQVGTLVSRTGGRRVIRSKDWAVKKPRLKRWLCRCVILNKSCTKPLLAFVSSSPVNRRRQWQPTPVLLPGKSHGQRSLVGCSPWGR